MPLVVGALSHGAQSIAVVFVTNERSKGKSMISSMWSFQRTHGVGKMRKYFVVRLFRNANCILSLNLIDCANRLMGFFFLALCFSDWVELFFFLITIIFHSRFVYLMNSTTILTWNWKITFQYHRRCDIAIRNFAECKPGNDFLKSSFELLCLVISEASSSSTQAINRTAGN